MVTVTFQIKPYLAAYMYMRYKNHLDVPPDRSSSSLSANLLLDTQPIYHFLHQLSIPHPPNASWHETGNITFTLPHPRNGKTPKVKYYKGFTTANGQEKNGSQIVELAEISNSYSDFTETDIINRNSKIIDSFVNFLRVNQLLKE